MRYLPSLEFNLSSKPRAMVRKKEGGPVIDMGPYYLTALVNLLGPAKEVREYNERSK